jgi:hypothetical protein
MEKLCAVIVFLAVYQLAGMLNYHDGPLMTARHVGNACHSISKTIDYRVC